MNLNEEKKTRKTKPHTFCKQAELKRLNKKIDELQKDLDYYKRYKEGYESAVDTFGRHFERKIYPLEVEVREYKYRLAQSENRRVELEKKLKDNDPEVRKQLGKNVAVLEAELEELRAANESKRRVKNNPEQVPS